VEGKESEREKKPRCSIKQGKKDLNGKRKRRTFRKRLEKGDTPEGAGPHKCREVCGNKWGNGKGKFNRKEKRPNPGGVKGKKRENKRTKERSAEKRFWKSLQVLRIRSRGPEYRWGKEEN